MRHAGDRGHGPRSIRSPVQDYRPAGAGQGAGGNDGAGAERSARQDGVAPRHDDGRGGGEGASAQHRPERRTTQPADPGPRAGAGVRRLRPDGDIQLHPRPTTTSPPVPANIYQGGDQVSTKTSTFDFGANKGIRQTGGTAAASWTNTRTDSTNTANTINPQFRSNLRLTFSQPLLRNRQIDSNRQSILTAEISRRIADISLRAATVNTVANTRNAYWDLVYAVQAVEAAKTSLALAQKLVEDNKVRVEIGTLAPLDIVSAQAEAATRQQTLVAAEANLRTAELVLKRLIVSGTGDPIWNQRLNPVDRPPTNVAEKVDLEAALRTALENRTDLVTSRKNLESSEVGLKYQHNQTLPSIDLTAYYQMAGTGGTLLERKNSSGVVTQAEVPGGYTDALSQLVNRKQPTWNVAVAVSYPIGTSAQDASYARAKLQYQQALAQLKALELTVATDITNQAMTVQSAFQQVQSAAASRELSQKRLEAEQSKFEVGMSTNYNVVLAQRDFTDAQNSELRAILTYRKALVDFQRKQETAAR